MKVLVLTGGTKERSLIQNALEKSGHVMILADSAEQARRLIEAGESRFVIADFDLPDVQNYDLIRRVRALKLPPVYFLMLTSSESDSVEADDTLYKPLSAAELKARIMIGQRFLSLGDSLAQARDQIENLAIYDHLTGLMNRSAFYRTAQGELERARRSGSALSLIALDIDSFKSFNEKYGIKMGDEILKIISQTIREKSRPYDCIGRWSGDEFVIALSGVIGADAEKIAVRILNGIQSTQITYKENVVNVGVSAGVASATTISAATEIEPLIQQARQAAARAKEAGGNQVHLIYT
jgi:diguanylate cyclase (GGDEF)-like protein